MWIINAVDVAAVPHLALSSFLSPAGLAGNGLADRTDEFFHVPCFAFLLTSLIGTVLVDTGPSPVPVAQARTRPHCDHVKNDHIFPRAKAVIQKPEVRRTAGKAADGFCLNVRDFLPGLEGRPLCEDRAEKKR